MPLRLPRWGCDSSGGRVSDHPLRQSAARARPYLIDASKRVFLALLLLACCLLAPGAAAQGPANVLVIFSNNRLLPANVDFDRGLNEAAEGSANVRYFAEFLDSPEFGGESYAQQTASYLREKYSARRPRVVVAGGQAALGFLLRYRTEIFPEVPVVHAAVDRAFLERHQLPADVIGTPADYDIVGTLRLALRLHPDARRVVVVTGDSTWDRDREAEVRASLAALSPALPVEQLAALRSEEITARLASLPRNAIVFTPGFFRDGAGRVFTPRESVEMMAAASGAPVYALFASQLGTGAVGGRMTSYVDMGRTARRAVDQLLRGDPASAVAAPSALPTPVQLDWRQVQKWGIRENLIPADAVIHFREPPFLEAHRTEAMILAAVLLLQTGLIAALLIERRLRRRTAAALADSEQRISLAARAARLSPFVWGLAPDGNRCKPAPHEESETAKQMAGALDQILQTVHPADRERFGRAVREAAASGAELDVEYRELQPDGEARWFVARGRVAAGEPNCLTGVKMDVTARKKAELQARADREALTHLSRVSTMGQLSASIAHQLNQPLAAILGNAETARKMLGRQEVSLDELREILDDIVDDDNRAAEVIRRLNALYRRGEMELSTIDLNDLVRETLELLRAELTMRHVTTTVELAVSLPPVTGGRIQLQQVLLNIILNAAEAMAGVDPDRRVVVVSTASKDGTAQVCIADRGTGIPPEDLGHVFDPFWTTKANGGGVGLAICSAIIAAHRGSLTVANDPAGGAVFCFNLPVQAAE